MRIWDIPPEKLCSRHLLGEHAELHALWSILNEGKKGFSNHPETKRWRGKLRALYSRHEYLVKEIQRRGFRHESEPDPSKAVGLGEQDALVNAYNEQVKILRDKKCGCNV